MNIGSVFRRLVTPKSLAVMLKNCTRQRNEKFLETILKTN